MTGAAPTRIFITGGSGLLGNSLLKTFAGAEISAPDLDQFDILDAAKAIESIVSFKPDLIIHAAAYTAVDKAEAEAASAFAVNKSGTETVAAAAKQSGAHLIYISTDYVFDGRSGRPYLESDKPCPLSVYGKSKLAGEEAVRALAGSYLIARTAWIFGPGRPNFVRLMADRAKAGEASRIVDDQVGSPTYTVHLAGALRELWLRRARGDLHVVNSGQCSWYEMTREIYRLMGADVGLVSPISTAEINRPAARPAYSVLATDALRRILGRSLPPWEQAVAEYLRGPDFVQPPNRGGG